jgi:hypothetical protein
MYEAQGYRVVRPEAVYGRISRVESGDAVYEGGYMETSPEQMYGSCSTLCADAPVEIVEQHLTAEPTYHVVLVVTLVAYLYMLLRSWKFINTIYDDILENQSERRMISQGGLLPLQHFKRGAAVLGATVLALVVVRLCEGVIPASSSIYIKGMSSLAVAGGLVSIVVFSAWLYAMHKVAEWLTESDGVEVLASIGFMNIVRSVVLLYPVAAVWLLADESIIRGASITLVVSILPIAILYLKDTFLFFVAKKIPILYWILYLCTAILLPLSFVMHILPSQLG